MNDDFNSAGAIGAMFDLIKTYYKLVDEKGAAITEDRGALEQLKAAIVTFDEVLGLFPDGFPSSEERIPPDVLALTQARQSARENRDFKKADELRDQVEEKGYIIEDRPDGQRIRRK
jgi:cysteinyl-tRNA synthetase